MFRPDIKKIHYYMKYIKLFEGFNKEDIQEEIDNWIEDNSDYISASALEDKLKELTGSDDIEATQTKEKDAGGDEYGEDWSTTVICVKHKGKDLMKVCVNSEGRYSYGMNSNMFGGRFFFDESLL